MVKKFIPRPQQSPIMDHIIKHLRCAVWCWMSGGKTSATLTALDTLSLVDDVWPALVIAPLRVANTTWPDEIKEWAHLHHLKASTLTGSLTDRAAALRVPADINTVNFENIKWLVSALKGKWPYKTIIVDESSKLAGFRLRQGGVRAQALAKVAFRSKRFIELTGTPSANGLAKLWGQLWFIDQGQRLGRTYTAFMDRWFKQSFDGFSYEPMPHAEKEIMELVRDVCLSVQAKDYYPAEEPFHVPIKVSLPPKAHAQYKELEKQLFLDLGEHQIEPLNAAAKTNKCLQFAAGAVYVDDEHNWVEVHKEKLKALESIIEEANGAPVMVAYNFVSDRERILKHFPTAVAMDKDPKTIEKWNKGKIPILVAHPASAGHGINLQHGGNILVYFGVNWNLEEHMQIAERLGPGRQKQSGYDRPVFYYYILAENTIDYLVMERLKSKRSVQDILLEAMSNAKRNSD